MKKNIPFFALSALVGAMLTGCGGGSSDATATTSISGKVADGYLSGASVCLDKNVNAVCDGDEPSAVTAADGSYSMELNDGDQNRYPLLVEVPATAIDSDTGSAVGQAYSMSAPAGQHAFVSPLTSLIHQEMLADASLTLERAVDKVKADTGLSIDLLQDYIAEKGNASNTAEDQAAYSAAHKAARVLVRSLQTNMQALGTVSAGQKSAAQRGLMMVAKDALMSQGSNPDPDMLIGGEDRNTLLAVIADATSNAEEATQMVSVEFDMHNNGSPVRCGDVITLANTVYDRDSKTAADPLQAQNTAGQLVDTRFYVANLMLTDAEGQVTPVYLEENDNQAKGVSLIDFGYNTASSGVSCTSDYHFSITGKVKPGTYSGVMMTIGVPVKSADLSTRLNHSNKADAENTPAPLAVTAMGWNWQGGRKFTKIEFMPNEAIAKPTASNPDATTKKWNVHIGSTGCIGDPTTGSETSCTNPNRLDLNFDRFDADSQKVVVNVAALFADSDMTFDGGMSAGCMSSPLDPECPAIFKALGIGLSGDNAGYTLQGEDAQSVFAIEDK
ncbi:MbnP family copper-binding protein [Thiomicrorhabdus sp.]|uniref:MbnP family copper-binding protein n=1 Tax=Thiomicrorhabdus sp. TaxID=2039724 RepID=UPI0029C7ABEE|nr:MbnP family copper-binding protein [Thiomicrorhabdus sp.]